MEKVNKSRIITGAIIIAGLYLMVSSLFLFRYTVIPGYLIILLLMAPGVLLTPVLLNKFNKLTEKNTHWAMQYAVHTLTSGSLVLFVFLALNYYSASEGSTHTYEVTGSKSISGTHGQSDKITNYAVVTNGKTNKTLPVSETKTDKIKISEGLLGFDVILTQ